MFQSVNRYVVTSCLILILTSCRGYQHALMSDADVTSLVWSPDGQKLAIGSADGIIHFWHIQKNELLLTIQANAPITALAWSPSGDRIASGSWSESGESALTLWDASSGQSIQTAQIQTSKLTALSWSPNGLTLSAGIHFYVFHAYET